MTGQLARKGGENVCRIPAAGIEGFVAAFRDALRTGVPAELLDGLATLSNTDRLITTMPLVDQRDALIKEQNSLRQARAAATRQAKRQTVVKEQDRWADEATACATRLEEIAVELVELDEVKPAVTLADEFDSEVSFLLSAAEEMVGKRKHSRDLLHRLDAILVDPQVRVLADARVEWRISVRLPADGGVVSLGPISWIPDAQPFLGTRLVWCASEVAGDPAPWLLQATPPASVPATRATRSQSARTYHRGDRTRFKVARDVLLEGCVEAGLSRGAAVTAMDAGLTPLPYVLLNAARGEDPPDWVPDAWADPAWVRWLLHAYTGNDAQDGNRGHWARSSWLRQACVDVTTAAGGSIRGGDLLEELAPQNLSRQEFSRIAKPGGCVGKPGKSDIRPWHLPLVANRKLPHPRSEHLDGVVFSNIDCPVCGERVETSVRVMEIVGDCLCPNGHMALADDPFVATAPLDYLWLRTPERVWRSARRAGKA